jgi:hypothetical protein
MTKDELIERAKRQLNAGQPQPHVWPDSEIDLDACVDQAIAEVADRVMRDPYLKTLLRQAYSVALDGSGVGDLLAATGSITGLAGEILQEGVEWGTVIDADNNVLVPLQFYAQFVAPQPPVFAYYCLEERKIYTRALGQAVNGPADIVGVTGPLSIKASFSPQTVDSFPAELEDHLVNTLCQIAVTKTPTNADA